MKPVKRGWVASARDGVQTSDLWYEGSDDGLVRIDPVWADDAGPKSKIKNGTESPTLPKTGKDGAPETLNLRKKHGHPRVTELWS